MMIVIRTAASLDHVMLEDVSKPEVQRLYKIYEKYMEREDQNN